MSNEKYENEWDKIRGKLLRLKGGAADTDHNRCRKCIWSNKDTYKVFCSKKCPMKRRKV